MALSDEETQSQNLFSFEGLYCEKQHFDDDDDENLKKGPISPFAFVEDDLGLEDELVGLITKEKEANFGWCELVSDRSLMVARREAVEWMLRVTVHYCFTALTAVLAVNYFDRFICSSRFQSDKPWMSQLCAVACLSLAAKFEETQVPLLLDLQVEEPRYVFEAKTIQRMELLVLCTLHWRLNVMTPSSFFHHIARRMGSKANWNRVFMQRCESLLLSVISDSRLMGYLPSVLAAATMLVLIKEVESCDQVDYQNLLISVLKVNEVQVCECCKIIRELQTINGFDQETTRKRKLLVAPGSPNGVMDASFSCETSNDSWTVAMASSISSPLEPHFKRRKTQDQQMRLPSLKALSSTR